MATRLQHGRRKRQHRRPRKLRCELLEPRLLMASDWTNLANPRDVNNDGIVAPLDALVAINELNHPTIIDATKVLPDRQLHPDAPHYDVTGDGFLTPRDVLIVINALNLDEEPPVIVAGLARDTARGGTTNEDGLTSDPKIIGTVKDLTGISKFDAQVDDSQPRSVEFDAFGNFSFDPEFDLSGKDDGSHTIRFTAQDSRGTAASVTVRLVLDTVAPAAPADLRLTAQTDSGASSEDGITNIAAPVVTGNGGPGDHVELVGQSGVLGQGSSTGSFEIQLLELSEGPHALHAVAEDDAGNRSQPSASLSLTVDVTLPEIDIVTPTMGRHLSAVVLDGQARDSGTEVDRVRYALDGGAWLTATMDDDGGFLERLAGLEVLATGTHQLTVSSTDVAGNERVTEFDFEVGQIEIQNSSGFHGLDYAVVGTTRPVVRVPDQLPAGYRIFNRRPDGRAGILGGPNQLGRDITQQFLADGNGYLVSTGLTTLIGVNEIVITDASLNELDSGWMVNYSTDFEDANGNGLLDLAEDTNRNGRLDSGEDTNANGLLDLNEDINGNQELDVQGFVFSVLPSLNESLVQDEDTGLLYRDGTIVLDFVDNASDAAISTYLRDHDLQPFGILIDSNDAPFAKKVVAQTPPRTDPLQLERTLNGLDADDSTFPPPVMPVDGPLEVAIVDVIASQTGIDVAAELLPERLIHGEQAPPTGGNARDVDKYDPDRGGFDTTGDSTTVRGQQVALDELNMAWAHFHMDTYAAHALIDKIPESPPNAGDMANRPVIAVIDTGVGNGTEDFPDLPDTNVDCRRHRATDVIAKRVQLTGTAPNCNVAGTAISTIADLPSTSRGTSTRGHGTTVTAIAAGGGAQLLGIGKDVRVRPVRIFGLNEARNNEQGGGSASMINEALREIATNDPDVKVINLSWGMPDLDLDDNCVIEELNANGQNEAARARNYLARSEKMLRSSIDEIKRRGDIIVTIASSNECYDTRWSWPAPELFDVPARGLRGPDNLMMAVSATDLRDDTNNRVDVAEAFASFSNYGARVSVSAPGGRHVRGIEANVTTTLPAATTFLDLPQVRLSQVMTPAVPVSGDELEVDASLAQFPGEGFVIVDDELIGYTGKAGSGTVADPFRLTGIRRGVFSGAFEPAGHDADTPVTLVVSPRKFVRVGVPGVPNVTIDAWPADHDELPVLSTEGFPANALGADGNGLLRLGNEIIRYRGTTAGAFQDIDRSFDGRAAAWGLPSDGLSLALSKNCPGPVADCPYVDGAGNSVLPVASTDGFKRANGVLRIGGELIEYANVGGVFSTIGGATFTGITRGHDRTDKAIHSNISLVVGSAPNSQFVRSSGTSFAAPHVAGLAGELLFLDVKSDQVGKFDGVTRTTDFTPREIVDVIEATADDLGNAQGAPRTFRETTAPNERPGDGPDHLFGFGRINAWKAALTVANGGLARKVTEDFNGNEALDLGPDSDPASAGLQDVNGNGILGELGEDLNDNGVLDGLFEMLPVISNADTQWYGFHILTSAKGATIWIDGKILEDTNVKLPDPNAARGNVTSLAQAYKGISSAHVAMDGVDGEDPTNGAVPVGNKGGEFAATFSIKKSKLIKDGDVDTPYTLSLRVPNGELTSTVEDAGAGTNKIKSLSRVEPNTAIILGNGANREGHFVTAVTEDDDGFTLTLKEQLAADHAAGTQITELQSYYNLKLELDKMREGEVPGVVFDDFVFEVTPADFGDAPPEYPTLFVPDDPDANGARHLNTNLEWFGQAGMPNHESVSPESNAGQTEGGPSADVDVDGRPNIVKTRAPDGTETFSSYDRFDDGVKFQVPYTPGEEGTVEFTVCAADPDSGRYSRDPDRSVFVNGWIDWNDDQQWTDAEDHIEHVVKSIQINPADDWAVVAGDAQLVEFNLNCATFRVEFAIPKTAKEEIWSRFRVDYGEDAGQNDPRPGFRSHASLRDRNQDPDSKLPGEGVGLVRGAARFGEVEDYLISSDFGSAPDPFKGESGKYPSKFDNDGARHLDTSFEWIGDRVDGEVDAFDDENDGISVPDRVLPGRVYQISVDLTSTIDTHGFDHSTDTGVASWNWDLTGASSDTSVFCNDLNSAIRTYQDELFVTPTESQGKGRYDGRSDDRKLWLNGWADWNADGIWDSDPEKNEHVLRRIPVAPETFGKDGKYTLGEPFVDVNGDGVYTEGTDVFDPDKHDFAGIAQQRLTCSVRAPDNVKSSFWWRFRLNYGEPGVANDGIPHHVEEEDRTLSNDKGAALFGEVSDKMSRGAPIIVPLKYPTPATVGRGGETTFTIEVPNLTTRDEPIQVVDILPRELTYVPGTLNCSSHFTTCQFTAGEVFARGTVPAGETGSLTFVTSVPLFPPDPPHIKNCARVRVQADWQEACGTVTVIPPMSPGFAMLRNAAQPSRRLPLFPHLADSRDARLFSTEPRQYSEANLAPAPRRSDLARWAQRTAELVALGSLSTVLPEDLDSGRETAIVRKPEGRRNAWVEDLDELWSIAGEDMDLLWDLTSRLALSE